MKKTLWIMMLLSIYSFGNIGTIMVLKGEAKIKRSIPLKAKMGMKILEGDEIITSKLSRMQVILRDETVVTIGANSTFNFKEFKFDGSKESKVLLHASHGYFRVVTGQVGKIVPDRFRVKTLTATIGVRGTDFSGQISEDNETIQCYSGAIWVKLKKGGIKHIVSDMLLQINDQHINVQNVNKHKPRAKGLEKGNHENHKAPKELSDVSNENVKPQDL